MQYSFFRLGVALSASCVVAAAGTASAGINVSNGAARFTTQTSDAGASPVYVVGYNQAINFSPPSPGDFGFVFATTPTELRPMTDNGLGDYYAQQSSVDESSEPVLQPTGLYTFSVEGGTLGDGQVSFTQPSLSFPSILSLTNYSSLLAADPAADFMGNLTAFTVDPSWSLALTYIQLTNQTTNTGAFSATLGPGDSLFALPSGTLDLCDSYPLRLQTISYKDLETFNAFGTLADATAYTNRVSITDITFTALPTPGSAAILGLAALAGARRRRVNLH